MKLAQGCFELGARYATRAVMDELTPEEIETMVWRHGALDQGDLGDEDYAMNVCAVNEGNGRIFSAYTCERVGRKVWVITEADRSATTVLFPEDY